jgi:hypothetical protein
LGWVTFSYGLLGPVFAAAELARWAIKPIPVGRYQPKPPRLIRFFGRAEAAARARTDSTFPLMEKAHVDGPTSMPTSAAAS